jgi:hypothetical protein
MTVTSKGADMSERQPDVPDTVEGEPVVDVQPATDPLTPDELREAQEREEEDQEAGGTS